jgi:CheY-like chemotaxis protein
VASENVLDRPVILVIDPDPVTLTAISAILHCANYEVHCARDRQAAWRGAQTLDLDLIICDDAIDGDLRPGLMDELRAIPAMADVPTLHLSSRQRPDVIHRTDGRGASYHLRKPVDPKVLVDIVAKALWQLPLINRHIHQPHFQTNLASSPIPV